MIPRRYRLRRGDQWVVVTEEEFRAATRPPSAVRPPASGLGDIVHAVATPIARALKLPCIDPATKQLRPESGCAKRREYLNSLSRRRPKDQETKRPNDIDPKSPLVP